MRRPEVGMHAVPASRLAPAYFDVVFLFAPFFLGPASDAKYARVKLIRVFAFLFGRKHARSTLAVFSLQQQCTSRRRQFRYQIAASGGPEINHSPVGQSLIGVSARARIQIAMRGPANLPATESI